MIAYLVALVALSAATKSDEFWSQLFATPRFRAGFLFYSSPFFIVGAALIAVGTWTPSRTPFVIARRVFVGLCVVALILAGLLMNVFGLGFDWKLSGP